MKFDKVKTFTLKFVDDGGFYIVINGKRVFGELLIPLEESKKVARSLSRMAMETYAHIDSTMQLKEDCDATETMPGLF